MFKLCLFLNYFLSVEDKEALGRLVDTTAHEVEHHVGLVVVGSELADACGLTIGALEGVSDISRGHLHVNGS